MLAMRRVTGLNLTYGDATGATGAFLNGAERLVDLVNRVRVLEMPLLSAPGESWCYVSKPADACLLHGANPVVHLSLSASEWCQR